MPYINVFQSISINLPADTSNNVWVSLHRADGTELSENDAPGYERQLYTGSDLVWKPSGKVAWGYVGSWEFWSEKTGGLPLPISFHIQFSVKTV